MYGDEVVILPNVPEYLQRLVGKHGVIVTNVNTDGSIPAVPYPWLILLHDDVENHQARPIQATGRMI